MLYNKKWGDKPTPIDILRMAADLIEEKGHLKHQLFDSTGAMCVNGAMWFAARKEKDLFLAANEILGKSIGVSKNFLGFWDLPGWNNAPERTGEEVIAKLRETADKYETVTA